MRSMTICCSDLVVVGWFLLTSALPCRGELYVPRTIHDVDLLQNGNLLVTDGGTSDSHLGGGIFEIDREGTVVWSYTTDLVWAHNADKQPNGNVIISDTGNDRVLVIDQAGFVLWNSDDISLSDGSVLHYPNDANIIPEGAHLITDRDNHRILRVDIGGALLWQFGETGVPGNDSLHLNGPHNADMLSNGNTLVADSNNDRVLEIAPDGSLVWIFDQGLDWPRDADRLPNGNTLINDSANGRIIEIDQGGATVWEYEVSDLSYDSDRLPNGNTLLGTTETLVEINPAGNPIWLYPPTPEIEVIEGYLVTAPNGNRLWTRIIQPKEEAYPGELFPVVVDVAGGLNAGEDGGLYVAQFGFVEFHFNAEGRGELHPSDGEEDHNGFIHHDDLKALIEFAHGRHNVLDDNLGVVTHSYGITMGAGCLGRYPELEVKYLIDVEGPSENFVTCKEPWALDDDPSNDQHEFIYEMFGHYSTYRDSSPENVAWWSEREATHYIGTVRNRYLRIQAEWDHAQPPNEQWPDFDYPPLWYRNKHAVDLVNLATSGMSPWTRVNSGELGNLPDTSYDMEHPPIYYEGTFQDHPTELQGLIVEMAAMEALSTEQEPAAGMPSVVSQYYCYPNPFHDSTTLSYTVSRPGHVRLGIYDLSGRFVSGLVNTSQQPGRYSVQWPMGGQSTLTVSSGTYVALLSVDDCSGTESGVQTITRLR